MQNNREGSFILKRTAIRKLFQSPVAKEERTLSNALAAIQFGTIEMSVPQDDQSLTTSVSTGPCTVLPPASHTLQNWPRIFPKNIAAPLLPSTLPPLGTRLETTVQLAHCNNLLHTHLSPSLAAISFSTSLDPSQQSIVNAIHQDPEEQQRIRDLTIGVIEEFIANSLQTSEEIAEVILLGSSLNQEYYRKLLSCFIAKFETSRILDADLLQGLVQLIQSASPDYLQPDDLVRILCVLRIRLQDTHQQTAKHSYYLILALSRLLDVMVEGKVQDLRRVIDHEPLLELLGQLTRSPDPYLKHQATYAFQGLLHIPNDETRRQYMVRQAERITMGLLGVASVCKLDLGQLKNGVDHLYKAAGDAHEVGTKIVNGAQSLLGSGEDIIASVKGSIFSGGKGLWYAALREAQEHVRNGRLANFNRFVFEAPCHRDVEFQWGVRQLLGQMTMDVRWEVKIRQHAVDLLVELYRNVDVGYSDKDINTWVLHFLRQIIHLQDQAIADYAQAALEGLEVEDNADKQSRFHPTTAGSFNFIPLQTHLPVPTSSPLLGRVLDIPETEYAIHRLRAQRMKERKYTLYIPLLARTTLQSSDGTLFPLMKKALAFLAGPGQVLLLLGDSGGGKSTFSFQLEYALWKDYKRGGPIPLYVNLPAIENPQRNVIDKQLQQLRIFSNVQIQELRQSRQFIVICDGYDESRLNKNLYDTNYLNKTEQWRAKMVISCRSQYLNLDYRSRFQPTGDRHQQANPDLYQELVIASFSKTQIEQYIEQYVDQQQVRNALSHIVHPTKSSWSSKDYIEKMVEIPKMIELVSNPFLLTLALRTLPRLICSKEDLSDVRLSRVELYDDFIKQWLETNKLRLAGSTLSAEEQAAFDDLLAADFFQQGLKYQKDLAAAIFQHQGGAPVVEYRHLRENRIWKTPFFATDAMTTILRESSPLTRSGNQFRFIHRSILEYLCSRAMSDPVDIYQLSEEIESSFTELSESFVVHPLNQMSIVGEPSIVQFLVERVELDSSFKARLLSVIEDSKKGAEVNQAAANAISILVKARVRFNNANLHGIKVPGADLRGGQFDSADLQSTDLRGVNLTGTWLRKANLSKAQMSDTQFGELPSIYFGAKVVECAFSFDGELLVMSTRPHTVVVYETSTWTKVISYPGGTAIDISSANRELATSGSNNAVKLCDVLTGYVRLKLIGHNDVVTCIAYSPDGGKIATASADTTARLWDTLSGDTLHILRHTEFVTSIAFSPNGHQLVSSGRDTSLQTWESQTGERLFLLEGRLDYDEDSDEDSLLCIAYSPDGRQIASGGTCETVVVWNAHTGKHLFKLSDHTLGVNSVAYSPDSRQIVSGGEDRIVRLWDSQNGDLINKLFGHIGSINSAVFSPNGEYIVSGSGDQTVRVWKFGGALPNLPLDSREDLWQCVCISPDGQQTVTSNEYGVVQSWDTWTGKPGAEMTGHSSGVSELAFSPCGEWVVSASYDGTIRMWSTGTGVCVRVLMGHIQAVYDVAFSPCGRQLASAGEDETVRIWDPQTGASVMAFRADCVISVVFSPDSHLLVANCTNKSAAVWCAKTGELLLILETVVDMRRFTFSPDGQHLFCVSKERGDLYCWNPQSGKIAARPSKYDAVFSLAFSPTKRLVATGGKGGLVLWDCTTIDWVEVFWTRIEGITDIVWVQGIGVDYLATYCGGQVRLWELDETDLEEFTLRLLWNLGPSGQSVDGADLSDAVGLSSVDLKLVKQRGAISNTMRGIVDNSTWRTTLFIKVFVSVSLLIMSAWHPMPKELLWTPPPKFAHPLLVAHSTSFSSLFCSKCTLSQGENQDCDCD
ncbi:hypothetical protein BGZ94_003777 [Podila epigama]|nr:hypothetical protein BGZ94_003777 [Podila epigama]